MTDIATADAWGQDCGCHRPQPASPVLLHRRLRPDVDSHTMARFAEHRWDLTPGIFEAHSRSVSLNFARCPEPLRPAVKHYFWELINHAAPRTWRRANTDRLSLRSIATALSRVQVFLDWLHTRQVTDFDQVTAELLDRFLDHVRDLERDPSMKEDYLHEVRRLWCYRDRLPASSRLPATPPWDGESLRDLLDTPRRPRENTTRRLHQDTLQPLLLWSLRFVEDFAEDITAALDEHGRLRRRGSGARRRRLAPDQRDTAAYGGRRLTPEVTAWLADRRERGLALPGHRAADGTLAPNWLHLQRLFDTGERAWGPGSRLRALIIGSGVPIADDAYLDTPVTGRLHGVAWRDRPVAYAEAPRLARLLVAACAVVIGYLSGQRPGELLSIERGCVEHDPTHHLWLLHGTQWKDATDDQGRKIPEGRRRNDPWVLAEPAAHAVEVLHRLHRHRLLFTADLDPDDTTRPTEGSAAVAAPRARDSGRIAKDIAALVAWVADRDGTEPIPEDPDGPVTLSRLRRTLAWHIVRRPRGLVAGAIQYGHLHVQITLGYAGSYASGFPDDLAHEQWLSRLEQFADWKDRLTAGEKVSGPAADAFRHRVRTATARFAGRVVTTGRQARDLLDNPLLHIFPGRAMTCVLDPAQALCQLMRADDDTHLTPDTHDCRPTCRNLAYTDTDIHTLRERAHRLDAIVADPLAPSPRKARDLHELRRLTALIRRHDTERRA